MNRNRLALVVGVALAFSLTPLAVAAQDGMGSVLVGQEGSAEDLALTDAEAAAAMEALAGQTVGIVATTLETEYHKLLNETARDLLESWGATVEICDSQVDAARALECFEGFVQKGVAGIITTSSAATVGEAAGQAIADGIVVVQVTGLDLGETGAVGISVNNLTIGLEEGRSAGLWAAELWPGETVEAIVLDYPDIPDLVARADAIIEGLAETNPDVTVVARLVGGLPDLGLTSTETALQGNPDIRLVTGINDGGNLGAYQALLAEGKQPGEVGVFGIDCDPAAVELIDAGTLYEGCVDTNPAGTGELAASAIAKLMAGSDVPGGVEVPVSTYMGPDAVE
jgi:ribose transport system substrate-binding protein